MSARASSRSNQSEFRNGSRHWALGVAGQHRGRSDSWKVRDKRRSHGQFLAPLPRKDTVMTDSGTTLFAAPTSDVGLSTQTCPRCACRLIRMGRRPLDRLISLFVLVHRYRCPGFSCRWEGCLRVADPSESMDRGALSAPDAGPSRTSRDPPAEPSITWDAAASAWVGPPAAAPSATPARF